MREEALAEGRSEKEDEKIRRGIRRVFFRDY
jgi:hypothetical protein